MNIGLIISCATFVLLLIAIYLLLSIKKRDNSSEALALLKNTSEEQRDSIGKLLGDAAAEQRESIAKQLDDGATEQFRRFGVISESVQTTLLNNRSETNEQLGKFSSQLDLRLSAIQEQTQKTLQANREETNKQLRDFQEQLDIRLSSIQRGNSDNIEKVNTTLENKMNALQESNEKRLEQMQGIVDEKLQKTLETRLSQSFELVNKQLDGVSQGLGEMKSLAADARSLKDALTNVKERGTYGEVRLEKLLADILAPSQYMQNVEIGDNKRVEFAVLLPGNDDGPLLLPIDSKFPIEDYNRLIDAQDKSAIEDARKALAQRFRQSAKEISDKYLLPPKTTDFALMFLPTEGLYAEVVQNPTLFEELRDKYKIIVVGASTLSAILASFLIGFKTLAIEQRSQEVWDTLRAVKSEFGKFGDMLEKAHKQIQTADKTMEELVGRRTRALNRTLRNVEEISDAGSFPLLDAFDGDFDVDIDIDPDNE
ncbi:MAG: DNA recombination protein RmuC [Oscillospiraceae bacterium]|nr:DNA recombination protein RmuC [Oscillospiraceae bacterium]